jgi:hypothetical protein
MHDRVIPHAAAPRSFLNAHAGRTLTCCSVEMAMKIVAFWLFAVGLIACGNVDSSCVHFSGDTGLIAGVCSDGEACTNFAAACNPRDEFDGDSRG